MGDEERVCNTTLGLAIGASEYLPRKVQADKAKATLSLVCLDLTFPLHQKEEGTEAEYKYKTQGSSSETQGQTSKKHDSINKKKKKNCSRKKLRLTKEQSSLLEDTFKLHSTLNTAQKHTLAEKLKLQPRQVEVWFQNRRARTKLKQTEVERGLLKKCCESLSEENERLKKELEELKRSSSLSLIKKIEEEGAAHAHAHAPLFIQLEKAAAVAATLTMCPSCVKAGGVGGDAAVADVVLHQPNKNAHRH